MDTIVTTAIVGTAQLGNQAIATGTPVDKLASQISNDDAERKLLLTAGAWALYRQAGRSMIQAPDVPQPAPPEIIAACSSKVGHLLEILLQGEHDKVLPEALERLKQLGQRFPHELLPQVLNCGSRSKEIRATLIPLLGERGRWLSQFNPAWSWVSQFLTHTTETLPSDAETIWEEGTLGQRGEILRRLRAIDPAMARAWLTGVWKQEKAEARTKFIETFSVGLSSEDEPFLENALDDRSEGVRTIAVSLLPHIPTSAFAQRMLVRADNIFEYSQGVLTVKPLQDVDINKELRRDGIDIHLQPNIAGRHAWYITQIISLVPPTHWEERFAATPTELIASAQENQWFQEIMLSWSYATILYGGTRWTGHLWQWLCNNPDHRNIRDSFTSQIHAALAKTIPQAEVEQYIQQQLIGEARWMAALPTLAMPWSKKFGEEFLRSMRQTIASMTDTNVHNWYSVLEIAATSLPSDCFDAALEHWELPDIKHWQLHYWRGELKKFTDIILTRKRIIEEII